MSFKKEKEVLEAALVEFSTKSFDDSSLNSIILRSGISKGSFYHHFKNKYDMYLYVLKNSVQKKLNYTNSKNIEIKSDNIFDLIQMQINTANKFGKEYPRYASLYDKFTKETNIEIYSRVVKDLGYSQEEGIINLIDNAYKQNQFKEMYPKQFVIKIIELIFNSYKEISDSEQSSELLIKFLKYGLSKE